MAIGSYPPAAQGNDYQCVGKIVTHCAAVATIQPDSLTHEKNLKVFTGKFQYSSFAVPGRNSPEFGATGFS